MGYVDTAYADEGSKINFSIRGKEIPAVVVKLPFIRKKIKDSMRVNVLFSPVITDELYFTGKTVVVIDVLRASTTIITALAERG